METRRATQIHISLMGLAALSLPGAYVLDIGIASALLSVVVPAAVITYLIYKNETDAQKDTLHQLHVIQRIFYLALLITGALLMLVIGLIFSGG